MAFRKLSATALIGGAILAAWRLSGLILVQPSGGSAAVIVAAGPLPIIWQMWPALLAAAGLAALVLFGVLDRAARRAATAGQVHALHDLHTDIERVSSERQRLRLARQMLDDQERAFEGRKQTDELKIRSLNGVRAAQERELERLRHELERVRGELTGARDHIRRIKTHRPDTRFKLDKADQTD